jgi:GntR family transcriptional regulator
MKRTPGATCAEAPSSMRRPLAGTIAMSLADELHLGEIGVASVALDRESPIPLYLQIKQHLLHQIAVWERQDDRFHTDSELCAMFGVSRMTVRQAVQALVDDGLVKRARGIGTFVVARKIEERLTPAASFREHQWLAEGRPISVDLLAYETRPCPPGFAEDLGVARSAPVRYVFRRRAAGDVPIALDHRYIPLEIAAGLTQADASRSILAVLSQRLPLSHGEIHLEATTAGEADLPWLGVSLGAPLMLRRLRYLAADNRCVLAGYTVYRADLVRYSVHTSFAREAAEPVAPGEAAESVVRLCREMAGRPDAEAPEQD